MRYKCILFNCQIIPDCMQLTTINWLHFQLYFCMRFSEHHQFSVFSSNKKKCDTGKLISYITYLHVSIINKYVKYINIIILVTSQSDSFNYKNSKDADSRFFIILTPFHWHSCLILLRQFVLLLYCERSRVCLIPFALINELSRDSMHFTDALNKLSHSSMTLIWRLNGISRSSDVCHPRHALSIQYSSALTFFSIQTQTRKPTGKQKCKGSWWDGEIK